MIRRLLVALGLIEEREPGPLRCWHCGAYVNMKNMGGEPCWQSQSE